MKECPVCHCSIDTLVDCLLDLLCWENRVMARSIMESCPSCKALVKEEAAINECTSVIAAVS